MKKDVEHFVGGKWIRGSGREFTSIDPYTGEAWVTHTEATEADVEAAVAAASGAFDDWRRTSGYERGRVLSRLADAIEENADRLAEMETRDNGKIFRENRNQIDFAVRNYRFFAGYADKITGETKPLDRYETLDFTTREPVGVAALITAWNSPLQLLANKLPPALAAGNTVVVKPSEYTSSSTLELGRIIDAVGIPAGVVNIITGALTTGEALTSHPDLGMISFTGGVDTARRILANAASNIVPATLELGGKSANIIFEDADLDRAIPGAVSGVFAAAGQTCVAGSRLLVHESIYDQVVEAVAARADDVRLGNPFDNETQMGPIAHRAHYERVCAAIEAAQQDGCRLVAGGSPPTDIEGGLFMRPTVFADVDNDMRLAQNEVFGPVLAVIRFRDDDDAIRIANDTKHGLAGGLWSRDITRAHTVAKEIRSGSVWINTYRTSAAQAPFGGFKLSGYGRERGTDVIAEYTRLKNTMIDLSSAIRDPFVLGT